MGTNGKEKRFGPQGPRIDHPGFILRRTAIVPRGLKQAAIAATSGVPPHSLSQLLNGRRPFSVDSAKKVGGALDIEPRLILEWQMAYDLAQPPKPRRRRRRPRPPEVPGDGGCPPTAKPPS